MRFADQRAFFGISNFWDVILQLPTLDSLAVQQCLPSLAPHSGINQRCLRSPAQRLIAGKEDRAKRFLAAAGAVPRGKNYPATQE